MHYGRGRIRDATPPKARLRPVDLSRALEHTLGLACADSTFRSQEYAWAVFYNQRTLESLNVLRTGSDQWNLSTPAYESDPRVCNKHICQANAGELEAIITRFFEGGDWRGVKEFHFDSWTYENEIRYGIGEQP